MKPPEFSDLRKLSTKLGNNALLVQAAGGNTSIKHDDVMWIKASGTWLMHANERDIFVPVDHQKILSELARENPDCENCIAFVRNDLNPSGLRPSIETSVHALMPQSVVLHVHCVNTLALAIRQDAQAECEKRLAGMNWAFVPYARPGLQLSRAIRKAMTLSTDILILQNHGLVVAAASVDMAEQLLNRVVQAMHCEIQPTAEPDMVALEKLVADTAYRPARTAAAHATAMREWSMTLAAANVYYPDHVVFLGTSIATTCEAGGPAVLIPGVGALIRQDAMPSVEPMLACLGNVFCRIAAGTALKALTAQDIDQLLNWDAEKYRQTLKPV